MVKYFESLFVLFDYLGITILYLLFFNNIFSEESKLVPFASFCFVLTLWTIVSSYALLYKNVKHRDTVSQYSSFFTTLLIFSVGVFLLLEVTILKHYFVSNTIRYTYTYFLLALFAYMLIMRIFFFLYRKYNRKNFVTKLNTIVIGKAAMCEKFVHDIKPGNELGILRCYKVNSSLIGKNAVIRIEVLKRFVRIKNIQNIVIFHNSVHQEVFTQLIDLANQFVLRMYVVPNFNGVDLYKSQIITYGGYPIIKPLPEPMVSVTGRLLKRIFDVFISFCVIIFLLSWLVPILSLWIKIDSKGPVFFKQKRSGYLNQEFVCYKFRSMVVNASEKSATKGDDRVTRVGRFLRKTSLDEFPQFYNVLKGNMSIVGPRPHIPSQTDQYAAVSKKYMIRHFAKPGITGWAQINGSRGEIQNQEHLESRIEKDIWYIQNWSFLLDIKIIFLTVLNIIQGDKQAY